MASPFSALRLIRSADAGTDELVSQGHVTEPIRHVPGTPRTRGPITAAAATIDVSDSAADALAEPVVVCRAVGTCVVPKDKQRIRR